MTFDLRKITSILISAAVVILAGSITAFAGNILSETVSAESEYVLGDADCDGQVTINDATFIQRILAEYPVNSDFSDLAADVDGSGGVEITDVTFIQLWLAGLRTPYPVGERFAVPVATTVVPTTQKPTGIDTDEEGWGREIFQP
jgi:hypothetical protein